MSDWNGPVFHVSIFVSLCAITYWLDIKDLIHVEWSLPNRLIECQQHLIAENVLINVASDLVTNSICHR